MWTLLGVCLLHLGIVLLYCHLCHCSSLLHCIIFLDITVESGRWAFLGFWTELLTLPHGLEPAHVFPWPQGMFAW